MQAFGGSLTVSPQYLMSHFRTGAPWQFDIAVIGSGYGASITAARLAQKMRPGTSLCVLERGREWITGTFPDTLKDCMDETRLKIFGMNKRRINNPTGLFNVLQGEEITVMSGNAIGVRRSSTRPWRLNPMRKCLCKHNGRRPFAIWLV